MLKHGIDIWAPKLPVERVIVEYPSLDDEMNLDLIRRRAIGYTLMRVLKYSKVDVTIGHPTISPTRSKVHIYLCYIIIDLYLHLYILYEKTTFSVYLVLNLAYFALYEFIFPFISEGHGSKSIEKMVSK